MPLVRRWQHGKSVIQDPGWPFKVVNQVPRCVHGMVEIEEVRVAETMMDVQSRLPWGIKVECFVGGSSLNASGGFPWPEADVYRLRELSFRS